jgi:hypothetical protein
VIVLVIQAESYLDRVRKDLGGGTGVQTTSHISLIKLAT